MAHFFERDDLPGVSGKIIEEHGSEYYRCEIDGQEYPVKYELIRPSGFDYRTGAVENARSASTRGPRLDKADYVQQLGEYEPGYTMDFCTRLPSVDLSNHIRLNKNNLEKSGHPLNLIPNLLADALYQKAKKYFPKLFDADIIVPVPNFNKLGKESQETKAVSIAKHLSKIFLKDEKKDVPCEMVLSKVKDVTTKGKTIQEKEAIYANNDVFGFNSEFTDIVRGKNIALIDDIITLGFAAHECLSALKNHVNDIYFYCPGTTEKKWRRY